MEDKTGLLYSQGIDFRFIKPVRHSRDKTLMQFAEVMDVDHSTIAKLERGDMHFSSYYETRFVEAMKRLRVSEIEIDSIRKILEMKSQRGYKLYSFKSNKTKGGNIDEL